MLSAAELRGLAEESLALLKEFLFDERFPALFDLEVYGSIIGMFELNNLSKPATRHHCHIVQAQHWTALSTAQLYLIACDPSKTCIYICSVHYWEIAWHRLGMGLQQPKHFAGSSCCACASPSMSPWCPCRLVCGVAC